MRESSLRSGREWWWGSFWIPLAVGAALSGCQGLLHAAGRVGFRPGMAEELWIANVVSVEVVLGEALRRKVLRVVYLSSTAVLGGKP